MTATPRALTTLLRRFDPDIQAIALATRKALLAEVGACHESIFPIRKWVSILYSTTPKRMKDNICLIVVYPDHVNLLFMRGVDLKDPNGLLEGTGKAMRHVKMRTVADVGRPGVRQLIEQAKKRPGIARSAKPGTHVVSMIKGQRDADARLKPRAPARKLPRLF